MSEQELLQDTDVEKAHRREDFEEHPILQFLDRSAQTLAEFFEGYRTITEDADPDKTLREQYIRAHFGFFADGIEQGGDFAFGPLEIIAIWSKVDEMQFSGYTRYKSSGLLTLAYATIPIPQRNGAVRYFLETGTVRDDLKQPGTVETVRQRYQEVCNALDEIEFYRFGVRKKMGDLLDNIRTAEGMEAIKQADKHSKSSPTRLRLGQITENFSNGLVPLGYSLRKIQ